MEGTKDGAALLEGGIVGSSASDASKTMATSGRFEVAKSSTATVGVWMLKGEEETGAMRTSLVTPDLFGPIVVRIVGDGLGHAVGDAVGNVAVTVGSSVNAKEGLTDGDLEGLALGLLDGSKLGDVLGVEVLAVGRELGHSRACARDLPLAHHWVDHWVSSWVYSMGIDWDRHLDGTTGVRRVWRSVWHWGVGWVWWWAWRWASLWAFWSERGSLVLWD